MFKDKVTHLLDKALNDRKDLFLVDFTIGADNKIRVVLDGDKGVNLADCMEISRAIEHNLDREEEDFALEVTSAGAAAPLTMPRQYNKNLGRKLEVKTQDGKVEGVLTAADQNKIVLEWKAREPKPIGKGKHTVEKKQEIAFSQIIEAKVVLKF
ncbi:MAG: ribosome assembly cofactor RimP [Croceitalea sp.]|nr:ribosome assembly cofactor RimP [Croceitalea sp.]MBT8239197.1 ribosome assembly cofactor RimP [Croceitalea sp.]NNL09645.1 ribosome assembly cofactor RimP [Croceitalea sp.]NNM17136.1 ribosome assembly cofactor RimP [Croceitalea sp.]